MRFFSSRNNTYIQYDMFLEYRHAELVSASVSFFLRFRNKFGMTYCKHTITNLLLLLSFFPYCHAELGSASASFILRFRNEFGMTYCKHTMTYFKLCLVFTSKHFHVSTSQRLYVSTFPHYYST